MLCDLDRVALASVALVCQDMSAAARRVFESIVWRARHLSYHELLDASLKATKHRDRHVAALRMRAEINPHDRFTLDAEHHLNPLHTAVSDPATPQSVIEALLVTVSGDANDHAIARRRIRGRLPLHTAALSGSPAAVALLLAAYSAGANERDSNGCLPLHLAALGAGTNAAKLSTTGTPEADAGEADEHATAAAVAGAVEVAEEEMEEAAGGQRHGEELPATGAGDGEGGGGGLDGDGDGGGGGVGGRRGARGGRDQSRRRFPQVVRALLSAHPGCAEGVDMTGMLPLHYAALYGAPLPIVRELIAAFPQGATHEAHYGWTPLNLAIVYGAAAGVTLAILDADPEGARLRSEEFACLPLHFAAQHRAPAKVLHALLGAHPAAATEEDGDGRLPLHLAAACRNADDRLVSTLIQAHEGATATPDAGGLLPLHHAVSNEASAAVVERLLHAHPGAAYVQVPGGMLPIHLAVAHHAPAESVRVLLRMFPEAAGWRTSDGALPIHVAAEHGASAASIEALLLAFPGGAHQRTRLGRLPVQLVARRGIIETDAGDVTARRSTRGERGAAEEAEMCRARDAASRLVGRAAIATESTSRGDEVVTGHPRRSASRGGAHRAAPIQ